MRKLLQNKWLLRFQIKCDDSLSPRVALPTILIPRTALRLLIQADFDNDGRVIHGLTQILSLRWLHGSGFHHGVLLGCFVTVQTRHRSFLSLLALKRSGLLALGGLASWRCRLSLYSLKILTITSETLNRSSLWSVVSWCVLTLLCYGFAGKR